jgi:phospholipid/cholesterol/gamma-HCH transport system substrate-binding protein
MEKDANYALVGLSTLILFMGTVIFSVWLARISFTHDNDLYDIIFQGPINGLSQGGEVRFNGIKVGEVSKIELYKPNPKNVVAHVRVSSDVPIRTDSFASTEPLGITGVTYVQISAGTATKPLLKTTTAQGKIPVILSKRSALADLLEGGGTVLTRTVEALDRVNLVLSDKNIKTFSSALSDTQAVTAELKSRKQLFADAQTAIQDFDTATKSFTDLAKSGQSLVDNDGKRTMKNVADAAEQANAAAKDLRGIMGKLEGPTGDFATNGLPQLTSAITSLQQAAESLDRLTREIEANPRGLAGKPPAVEKEVKP